MCQFNYIQDGLFRGCLQMRKRGEGWVGGDENLSHISNNDETWHIAPYLKKIQKIYQSRDIPLEFRWHQKFFTGNQQILLYQEIHA